MKAASGIVYRIAFADGYVYIGQTFGPLEKRLGAHITHPTNPGITERVRNGIGYEASVLFESDDPAEISEFEIEAIRAEADQSDMLNVVGIPAWRKSKVVGAPIYRDGNRRRKRTDYPQPGKDRAVRDPTVVSARCSICFETKQAAEFHRDRCRHNGLGSRCRVCYNAMRKIRASVESDDPVIRGALMPAFQQLIMSGADRTQAVQEVIRRYNN